MEKPDTPENELARLEAVIRTGLLDTPEEKDFDQITELMSFISEAPISLITLLDEERNFLKSHHGVPFQESPRDISFCGHAINENSPIMIVPDARKDKRFRDNPLVTEFSAVFYAGVPVKSADGFKLGTLCIFDHKPRELDNATRTAMLTLAAQVEKLYELRRVAKSLINSYSSLQKTYHYLWNKHTELSEFSRVLAHDIKTPASSLSILSQLLIDELSDNNDEESLELAQRILSSSSALCHYIEKLLSSKQQEHQRDNTPMSLSSFMEEVKALAVLPSNVHLTTPNDETQIPVDHHALMQILLNLVTNAIKYNDKPRIEIDIDFAENSDTCVFTVSDNGMGIDPSHLESIFDPNYHSIKRDQFGEVGTGTGLATIKIITEQLHGTIQCESKMGVGTRFTVCFPNQNYQLKAA